MALATKCPHCNTIFRVAHDQLKLRGGIVRCGACNEVFDGNAALVEPVAKPSPVMPSVPVAFAPVEPPHHLDPETVAGALAEERLQDEAPAAPELRDAASGDDGADAFAAAPETTGDSGPSSDEPPLAGQDIVPGTEPVPPSLAGDQNSAEVPTLDAQAVAPADAGPDAPADADAIAAADVEAAAQADAEAIVPAGADSIAAAEAESILQADDRPPADEPAPAELPAGDEPPGDVLAGDVPPDDVSPDDVPPDGVAPHDVPASNGMPLAGEPAFAADEQPAAADDLSPAGHAREAAGEQAASLDFIVDPDEFTDPLASPQAQDTAREHLVAAALDEAHHFDDLPAEDTAADPAPVEDHGEWQAAPAEDATASDAGIAAPPAGGEQEALAQQDEGSNRSADEAAAADLIGAAPESASLAATGSAAAAATAAAVVGTEDDGAEEPGFVKRANRRQRLHRISKAVMAFGSPILLAALIAQGVTTFRNPLAAAFPALKPTLNSLCEPLGCKVNLPMQIDMLAIEQGELQTLADNTFSFATVLRNQARSAQSWPSIELTLNDASDKALVRRVFTPRDYLPSQADVDKGFAPRSEQSIKLYFELGQVKASGYHIAIFYP